MEQVYFTLFAVGVLYTFISAILGQFFDFLNLDGDLDLGGELPWFSAFIRPINIVIFITVFGGIGLMGERAGHNSLRVLIASFCAGVLITFLVNRFIIKPLYKAQNTSAPTDEELIGLEAEVISKIYPDGFGTIGYTFKGNRFNSLAKHMEGKEVKKRRKSRHL